MELSDLNKFLKDNANGKLKKKYNHKNPDEQAKKLVEKLNGIGMNLQKDPELMFIVKFFITEAEKKGWRETEMALYEILYRFMVLLANEKRLIIKERNSEDDNLSRTL